MQLALFPRGCRFFCLSFLLLALAGQASFAEETPRRGLLNPQNLSPFPEQLTPLIFATPGVWPWGYKEPGEQPAGTLVRFAERLSAVADLPLMNRVLPHRRALRELETGEADFVPLFESPGAEAAGIPVEPIVTTRVLVVSRAADDVPLNIEGLAGEAVGYIRGTWYGEAFANNREIRKVAVADLNQAVEMLLLGRIRALVSTDHVFYHTIEVMNESLDQFQAGVVISEQKGILYMSRKARHPELFLAVRKAIRQMRATGELEEIFRLPDWPEVTAAPR
ncbi:substrate-binding periplasmic protein [Marinobacter sp.]|uniref:substrate-binding periplasmic protein n=1 Tax=Marinobacter sp. TaxID=50741 RepID=UPI00384BFE0C